MVSAADAERWLAELPDEQRPAIVDALTDFGNVLLSEVTGRRSALDSKATSILGWSGVPLGFLLVGSPEWIQTHSWLVVGLAMIGITLALGSAACAFESLRARQWKWPSQPDWFRQGLLGDLPRLRQYHLLSMLETHQEHASQNADKAAWLVLAQKLLASATTLVGVMAVVRIVELFLATLL